MIDPGTRLGAVRLNVSDIDAMTRFYESAIGLRTLERDGETVRLGAPRAAEPVVELAARPDAPRRPPRTTGLFHLAILVPDRRELARSLRRVSEAGWRFSGASDHLVSEALYLSDPERNGIEIYRDRAREEWERDEDGEIRMSTLPLDIAAVLGELEGDDSGGQNVAQGTRIGHVHLNVADLAASEELYAGSLGFEVTVRGYPGALFLAAGGYHHHIGLNTWNGAGAPAAPPGALGLDRFEIVLPDKAQIDAVERALAGAGVPLSRTGAGLEFADPSANRLLVR